VFTKTVLEGIKLIFSNFSEHELKNPNLRLGGLIIHRDRRTRGHIEARDIVFAGDFHKIQLNIEQSAQVLADVAQSLTFFHEKGLVHRDIKLANIFISLGQHPRGYLADFDLAQKIGYDTTINYKYPYWDELSRIGAVTPLTDMFGLAQCAAQKIFKMRLVDVNSTNFEQSAREFLGEKRRAVAELSTPSLLSDQDNQKLAILKLQFAPLNEFSKKISAVFLANRQAGDLLKQDKALFERLEKKDANALHQIYQLQLDTHIVWRTFLYDVQEFSRKINRAPPSDKRRLASSCIIKTLTQVNL